MGPYCRYCDQRCFTHITEEWPEHIRKAYRQGVTIVATCRAGQAWEKEHVGYCYADARAAIDARHAAEAITDRQFNRSTDNSSLYG